MRRYRCLRFLFAGLPWLYFSLHWFDVLLILFCKRYVTGVFPLVDDTFNNIGDKPSSLSFHAVWNNRLLSYQALSYVYLKYLIALH